MTTIQNIHLLELDKIDITALYARTAEQRIKHNIQYTILRADPESIHIYALQGQNPNTIEPDAMQEETKQLFNPFSKNRIVYVKALPYWTEHSKLS